MFHIPYSMRERVGSNRFSSPGTPCLYLSGSSYICWLESGKPSDNFFNVSLIKPKILNGRELKVLDLSLTPLNFGWIEMNKEFIGILLFDKLFQKFLITWPLTIACSIKVTNPNERNRNFKSEYIIPQLILQSLKKHNIDGVAYLSTHINYSRYKTNADFYPNLHLNYAFPAKFDSMKLRDSFQITDPLNFADIKNVLPKSDVQLHHMNDLSFSHFKIDERDLMTDREYADVFISNSAIKCKYKATDFYLLEKTLFESELFNLLR